MVEKQFHQLLLEASYLGITKDKIHDWIDSYYKEIGGIRMLKVTSLKKTIDNQTILDDVSFTLQKVVSSDYLEEMVRGKQLYYER